MSNGSSYKAMDWAWNGVADYGISPTQKLVLLNICGRVDQLFSSFPSVARMSRETGLNRATVYRALSELELCELLVIAERTRPNGSRASSRYYVNHPEAPHIVGDMTAFEDDPVRYDELRAAVARSIGRRESVDNHG